MTSPILCRLPFQHLFINNGGYINPCCIAYPHYIDENKSIDSLEGRNVNRHGVLKAYHSAYLNNVRDQFRAGIWPVKCASCRNEEAWGIESPRLRHLTDYPATNAPIIRTMELRLGNICNLKCRMCSPFSSQALFKEWNEGPNKMMHTHAKHYENLHWVNWSENKDIWQELGELAENLEQINFAGGEPLRNQIHVEFLRELIETGKSCNIKLSYNTNLTVIPNWLEEILPTFGK